jgi:crotonobetainyl-CoA:carnitine CoA-transferase CaiB-like acyl-CoA transferase
MDALEGVRVVDFSRLAPGPMAAMMLGDLGADVVKVEEPGGGRRAQQERALKNGDDSEEQRWRAVSPLERNKRSLVLNLRAAEGKEVALQLITRADVVVEGYRPGVMRRLGLDYDSVRTLNSRLIYCSISGYGQTGPKSASVGHDLNYLAYAGALSLIGTADGRPIVPLNLLADYAGGSLIAVAGILAALVARSANGEGQFVDVSMVDGVIGLLSVEVARLIHSGKTPLAGKTYLTGGVAYYNLYGTQDGRLLSVACNEPAFFRKLCDVLDLPNLPELQFVEEAQAGIAIALTHAFRQKTLSDWMELLDDTQIPIAPVRPLDEVIADPNLHRRKLIVEVEGREHQRVTQAGSPIHLSRTPVNLRWAAPVPGEHTAEILGELGYDATAIARLAEAGVVSTARTDRR